MPSKAAPPRQTRGRALAPDLARGAMLLLIAIANVAWFRWTAPGHELSALDRAVRIVSLTAIDARVYPMFAFLLGYGMVQFTRARLARGLPERDVAALLRRRHAGLIVVGAAHGILLFIGDIVGSYGLAGLVLVALLWRRRDRVVLAWAAGLLAVFAALSVVEFLLSPGADLGRPGDAASALPLAGSGDYLDTLPDRSLGWLLLLPAQGLLSLIVPACILLGWIAARRRILEEPQAHLRLLRWTAAGGIVLAWSEGLMRAAGQGLFTSSGTPSPALLLPEYLAGMAGGLGYAALFGLLAVRMSRRHPGPGPAAWIGRAVKAVGRRSLTCYLLQSAMFVPLLSEWGLGFGGRIGVASAAALAVAVWLVTVVVALGLERAGRRGPAEAFLALFLGPRSRGSGGAPQPTQHEDGQDDR